jgi:hypothetical protein
MVSLPKTEALVRVENSTFEGVDVVLDGNEYVGCVFRRCTLVFSGSAGVALQNNRIEDCSWRFDGAAQRTLAFMSALYQGGAIDLIEKTFDTIRSGKFQTAR